MSSLFPDRDPAFVAWVGKVSRELVPKIRDSIATVVFVPQGPADTAADIKVAVEIGIAILLDKPIIAAIAPGMTMSAALAKVADDIVEIDIHADPSKAKIAIGHSIMGIITRREAERLLEDSGDV